MKRYSMCVIVYKNSLGRGDFMTNKVSIIGCGGHARSVADVLIANDADVKLVFYDRHAKENEVYWGGTTYVRSLGRQCLIV